MKISLVTNKSLKRSYENLKLANRKLVEQNNILIAEKTAFTELIHNQKEAINQLLKEKELLAYRASCNYLEKSRKET